MFKGKQRHALLEGMPQSITGRRCSIYLYKWFCPWLSLNRNIILVSTSFFYIWETFGILLNWDKLVRTGSHLMHIALPENTEEICLARKKKIIYNLYVVDFSSCKHQKPDLWWIKQKINLLAPLEKCSGKQTILCPRVDPIIFWHLGPRVSCSQVKLQ